MKRNLEIYLSNATLDNLVWIYPHYLVVPPSLKNDLTIESVTDE